MSFVTHNWWRGQNFSLLPIEVWTNVQSLFGIFTSSDLKRNAEMQWQQLLWFCGETISWMIISTLNMCQTTWFLILTVKRLQEFRMAIHLKSFLYWLTSGSLVQTQWKFHLINLGIWWRNHFPLTTSGTISI